MRLFVVGLMLALTAGAARATEPLRLVNRIPLPGVDGRIDHLAVDPTGKRLFVAALGANSVEIIDLARESRIGAVDHLNHPQGVAWAAAGNRLFVTNADDGACDVYDGTTLKLLKTVDFGSDADNLRTDAAAGQIFVGYGEGGIGILDARSGRRVGDIPVTGHPEAFQLEPGGSRIFVNVPDNNQIVVLDRVLRRKIAEWPVTGARANFPMALDEADHRLYIGCREPARLLVYDTVSGKETASLPIDGDTDDLYYDAARGRIYASCGAGFLDVIECQDHDHYTILARYPTSPGARTSIFVPELNRLYLAVPHHRRQQAEIEEYAVSE